MEIEEQSSDGHNELFRYSKESSGMCKTIAANLRNVFNQLKLEIL